MVLKLGIMKHRQPGRRWDRRKWRLGLATKQDSQHTIRIPHGLVVDHVQVPEFSFDHTRDLSFEIIPLKYGPETGDENTTMYSGRSGESSVRSGHGLLRSMNVSKKVPKGISILTSAVDVPDVAEISDGSQSSHSS